jgi:DNA-binding MarR family transcriptional regulator
MAGAHPTNDVVDGILEQWAEHAPGVDVSPMAVFGRMHRCFLRYQTQVSRVFAEYDVSMATFGVLAALRRSGEPYSLTVGELADIALVTSGGSTQRVARLESAGLVVRERTPEDARVVQVRLTDKGHELIDRLVEAHFANERQMIGGLTDAERRRLEGLLRKLERSLETNEVRQSAGAGTARANRRDSEPVSHVLRDESW